MEKECPERRDLRPRPTLNWEEHSPIQGIATTNLHTVTFHSRSNARYGHHGNMAIFPMEMYDVPLPWNAQDQATADLASTSQRHCGMASTISALWPEVVALSMEAIATFTAQSASC